MSVPPNEHLKPAIIDLLQHFSAGSQEFVKNHPDMSPQDVFTVLYQATLSTLGQVLAAAFSEDPDINQLDVYNRALQDLKYYAEKYHRLFLTQKEMKNGNNTKPT